MAQIQWLLGDGTLAARQIDITVTRSRNGMAFAGYPARQDEWKVDITHDNGEGDAMVTNLVLVQESGQDSRTALVVLRQGARDETFDPREANLESPQPACPQYPDTGIGDVPLRSNRDQTRDVIRHITHGLYHALRDATGWNFVEGSPLPPDAMPGQSIAKQLVNVHLPVTDPVAIGYVDVAHLLGDLFAKGNTYAEDLCVKAQHSRLDGEDVRAQALRSRFYLMLGQEPPTGMSWDMAVRDLVQAGLSLQAYDIKRSGVTTDSSSGRSVRTVFSSTTSALREACETDNAAAAAALVRAGADPLEMTVCHDRNGRHDDSPLWTALQRNAGEVVQAMIDAMPTEHHAQAVTHFKSYPGTVDDVDLRAYMGAVEARTTLAAMTAQMGLAMPAPGNQ